MRDAGTIIVQRAIVHLIDHVKQELTRSDAELVLTGENEPVRAYFAGQIGNVLRDQMGSARFARGKNRAAMDACFTLLRADPPFVAASQELARLLMTAMGTSQSIRSGDLAVCLYTASNYPATTFL